MSEQPKKQHCISITGVKLWNTCDENITNCKSIDIFRKRYKENLIKLHLTNCQT